jgi:hypothetical protein
MTHLTHDDLVLHYYGETPAADEPAVDVHLGACEECQAAFARLQQVLALVDEVPVPDPGPAFEATTWARLQDHLSAPPRPWWQPWNSWRAWVPVGATAALVIGAFLAGWLTRSVPAPSTAPANAPVVSGNGGEEQVRTRVLLIAVGDHLQRSERVLSEVLNGPDVSNASLDVERERAADLVAASRLYRQTATLTGDDALEDTLEDLERVLQEIANAPPETAKQELDALRAQVESRGLLFRVRVLTNDLRAREVKDAETRPKGPTS